MQNRELIILKHILENLMKDTYKELNMRFENLENSASKEDMSNIITGIYHDQTITNVLNIIERIENARENEEC